MKKIFIALSVLAALIFSVVPSQALVGLPDDVPGCDVVLPFIVAKAGGLNTYLVLEDVRGGDTDFHYVIWTRSSVTVYDDDITGTKYDVVSTDAWTLISNVAPASLPLLEVTLDGVVYYAGYITFTKDVPNNSIIGQTLIMNVPAGRAAGANAWIKEVNANVPAIMTDGNNIELWSANSLARAEQLQVGAGAAAATRFGLYPRYYIMDANAATWLIIWKDTNTPAADLHLYFYDNEEHKASSNLPLPYELNLVDVEPYIPLSIWAAATYPKEGFIAIETPDLSAAGFLPNREWAGYTYIFATGAASESWSYLTNIHRDVFWSGNW